MNKLLSISILASMLVVNSYASKHKAHWAYEGKHSPTHWGEMKADFKMCSKGRVQSPINIIATRDVDIKKLKFNYNTKSKNVVNNGHTVQVNIKNGSSVSIDGLNYELKQFHFHTPSENNINGKEYPLEAHFVHATKNGKLAVIAVMFEYGKANPIINKIWRKFPLKLNHKVSLKLSSNDIKAIMPKNKDYYKFMGSLTTPPCSESVKWNVYKTSVSISKAQVKKFFDIYNHSNNRPIQKTHNRVIYK